MPKNLLQMAQRLASDVGRADDSDLITKAKEILADCYVDIWDRAPWKGSLALLRKASSTNYRVLSLPYACAHLMGVRCGTRELSQLPYDLVMMGAYDRFQETGNPVEYVQIAPALWTSPTYPSPITTLRVGYGDGVSTVKITWTASNGEQYAGTYTPPATGTLAVASNVVSLDAVSQDGAVPFVFYDQDLTGLYAIATNYPNPVPTQRILFTTNPEAAETYTLLFKRKPLLLTNDSDIPALNGVERCLMDYAHAALLEYLRQSGKAQAKRAEAEVAFELLRRGETWQEQTLRRLIPQEASPVRSVVYGGYDGWPKNP